MVRIVFVVTRDKRGRERLYVRRAEGSIRAALSELRRGLKTWMGPDVPRNTEKIVRHFVGPDNYVLNNVIAVDNLGGSHALEELESLVEFLRPIIWGLAG